MTNAFSSLAWTRLLLAGILMIFVCTVSAQTRDFDFGPDGKPVQVAGPGFGQQQAAPVPPEKKEGGEAKKEETKKESGEIKEGKKEEAKKEEKKEEKTTVNTSKVLLWIIIILMVVVGLVIAAIALRRRRRVPPPAPRHVGPAPAPTAPPSAAASTTVVAPGPVPAGTGTRPVVSPAAAAAHRAAGTAPSPAATGLTPNVSLVSVIPATVTLDPGKTQKFSAIVTVTGGASKDVEWALDSPIGDIDKDSGLYTAPTDPKVVTVSHDVEVKATSKVDKTKFGTAKVHVNAAPAPAMPPVAPIIALLSVLFTASAVHAAPLPAITSVYPGAVAQGSSTVSIVRGSNLSHVVGCAVALPDTGCSLDHVVSNNEVVIRVTAGPAALGGRTEPIRGALRLRNADGTVRDFPNMFAVGTTDQIGTAMLSRHVNPPAPVPVDRQARNAAASATKEVKGLNDRVTGLEADFKSHHHELSLDQIQAACERDQDACKAFFAKYAPAPASTTTVSGPSENTVRGWARDEARNEVGNAIVPVRTQAAQANVTATEALRLSRVNTLAFQAMDDKRAAKDAGNPLVDKRQRRKTYAEEVANIIKAMREANPAPVEKK